MPSKEEIVDNVRRLLPGLTLYHPGDEWWSFPFSGGDILFPPDLPGHPKIEHPRQRNPDGSYKKVKADGRVLIKDHFGTFYDARTRKPKGRGPMRGHEAVAIVAFALENYSEAGVVLLEGDEKDDARIEAAKQVRAQNRRTWAEAQVRQRAAFLEEWRKKPQNQGQTPPLPTKNQRDAQEILDELKVTGAAGTFKYVCPHGCYAGNDRTKFERHLQANHPEDWADWKDATSATRAKMRKSRSKKDEGLVDAGVRAMAAAVEDEEMTEKVEGTPLEAQDPLGIAGKD